MATAWVDIDVEDFYEDLTPGEKLDLIELLKEDGLLPSDPEDDDEDGTISLADIEWAQMIQKINSARYQLTAEQESMLINLTKSL
jgi:CxxC motif-containing protein (DUF1111 family)